MNAADSQNTKGRVLRIIIDHLLSQYADTDSQRSCRLSRSTGQCCVEPVKHALVKECESALVTMLFGALFSGETDKVFHSGQRLGCVASFSGTITT
jgi:hypothetical protein